MRRRPREVPDEDHPGAEIAPGRSRFAHVVSLPSQPSAARSGLDRPRAPGTPRACPARALATPGACPCPRGAMRRPAQGCPAFWPSQCRRFWLGKAGTLVHGAPAQQRLRVGHHCDAARKLGRPAVTTSIAPADYIAASSSFFKARVLIRTLAGLAAITRSTFVKRSMPRRFFLAGTLGLGGEAPICRRKPREAFADRRRTSWWPSPDRRTSQASPKGSLLQPSQWKVAAFPSCHRIAASSQQLTVLSHQDTDPDQSGGASA